MDQGAPESYESKLAKKLSRWRLLAALGSPIHYVLRQKPKKEQIQIDEFSAAYAAWRIGFIERLMKGQVSVDEILDLIEKNKLAQVLGKTNE